MLRRYRDCLEMLVKAEDWLTRINNYMEAGETKQELERDITRMREIIRRVPGKRDLD